MAVPTISSCSPSSGPKAGGTAVQIIGTDFTGATAVTFDGDNATRFCVIEATHVLAVTPAGSGIGDVVVTTAGGSGTLTDGFTYAGIFATVAECASKAGENVDETGWTTANIDQWLSEIESQVNVLCGYNFSDVYDTLNADVKKVLTLIASNYVGIQGIMFNMAAYTSRIEAEDMINVLWAAMQYSLNLLKDPGSATFMKGET